MKPTAHPGLNRPTRHTVDRGSIAIIRRRPGFDDYPITSIFGYLPSSRVVPRILAGWR